MTVPVEPVIEGRGFERLSRHADAVARLTDDGLKIPGTDVRLGIDPLVGLLPGWGDTVAVLLSGWIVVGAAWNGAPAGVVGRMLLNLAVDALVGAIPVLGDFFDFAYKANRRNADLLHRYLADPTATRRRSGLLVVASAGFVVGLAALIASVAAYVILWVVSGS